MRIALLSHASHATTAGGDDHAPALHVHACTLTRLGHQVHIFTSGNLPDGTQPLAQSTSHVLDGVPYTHFGRSNALRRALVGDAGFGLHRVAEALADASDAFAGLRRSMRDETFDLVEVIGDSTAAGLVALCDGTPALVRLNSIWSPDGSTAERLAARRMARLGLQAARAVSVPSLWLRDHLRRTKVYDNALVVPDGVVAPKAASQTASGHQLFAWFDDDQKCIGDFAHVLNHALSHDPALRVVVAGPNHRHPLLAQLGEQLAHAENRLEVPKMGTPEAIGPGPDSIGFYWFARAPSCPPVLLQALAAGQPLAVRTTGCIPEIVRHDLDALLFDSADGACRKLDRLQKTASLRDRLGRAAHQRALAKFQPEACTRRRLQVYELAAGHRSKTATKAAASPAPTVELGPHNWFLAWWLASAERQPTRLQRDASGRPTLLDLAYDELKVVEAVLVRSWCDGPKDWSAPEWAELRDFDAQVLDRLDDLRRKGALEKVTPAQVLAFPPANHAMFGPDQPATLLGEVWRLENHERWGAWLADTVRHRNFAAKAKENIHLRRIAVEAAIRVPSLAVFEELRRIYRDARCHNQVVDADREFVAKGVASSTFENGIKELGLHASLASEHFPTGRRPRRKSTPAADPRITVLIPSYRHENYIGPAIESCLRQTIADLRVLVADDRSPDGTVAAAMAIEDPRLQVVVNPENLGLGASVLNALAKVETPYVALLNSDDLFHPKRLAECLAVLESDANASLVATGFTVVDRNSAVLTQETSCAAEIGPLAHQWLRWFEGISRDELKKPDDWTSFDVLLRHNVLTTSSNMVFRTDWLRAHMPEASRLKYCVDWQLFLQAAMEGSLRMVAEPLLAYRLHDSNTVWFREGGRADYVMEVNRVVDRVLGQWLEKAVARDGAGPAVERLAQILEQDVRQHGESDGLALYLSDLARRFANNAVDPNAAPIAALAEAALRRNAYAQVIRKINVDPWSLPWRAQIADRWRLEHEVAEGYVARARSLDADCHRLRIEQSTQTGALEDARSSQQRLERELAAAKNDSAEQLHAAEQRRLVAIETAEQQRRELQSEAQLALKRAETDFAEAKQKLEIAFAAAREGLEAELASTRHRLEAELAHALQEHEAKLADTRQELETELAATRLRLEAELAEANRQTGLTRTELASVRRDAELAANEAQAAQDELQARNRDLAEGLDERRVAFDALAVEAAGLETRIRELDQRLAQSNREIQRLQAQLLAAQEHEANLDRRIAALTAELGVARTATSYERRLRNRAIDAAMQSRAVLSHHLASPAWHLGDRVLRKLGLLQAYKTLAALSRRSRAMLQRGAWHLGRVSTAAGRQRTGVAVFGDSLSGGLFDERCLRWLADAGDAPHRLIAWGQGLPRHAPREIADLVRDAGGECTWLAEDANLDRVDRAYFARRNPAVTNELDRWFAGGPWPNRAYRGARVAKTTGAGVAIAQGLRAGAIQAYACKRLCGLRFVLTLGDEDLLELPFGRDAAFAMLAAVDLLVVDSDLVLQAVEQLMGKLPAKCVVRWALPPQPLPPAKPHHELRAFVQWSGSRRADPQTLVEGMQQAVAAGLDLNLDVVGDLGDGPDGMLRWLQFEDLLAVSGMASRVRLHGAIGPSTRRQLLQLADVVLWIGRSAGETGLPPTVLEGLAHGRPVIASAVRELTWLPAIAECVELVPEANAGVLAQALVRCLKDPGAIQRRVQTAREVLKGRATDDSGQGLSRSFGSPQQT